jgi:hypothetical protein
MNDNSDDRLDALFTAARQDSADTSRAEWGFETRVMARLREESNPFASVVSWAWKLCPFFAALAVATALWSRTESARVETEEYLLTQVSNKAEEQVLLTYLTGEAR